MGRMAASHFVHISNHQTGFKSPNTGSSKGINFLRQDSIAFAERPPHEGGDANAEAAHNGWDYDGGLVRTGSYAAPIIGRILLRRAPIMVWHRSNCPPKS